ncbi:hypothetical protein CAter282_2218 [Collimonas arenae]|uniref:Uncharacterized protein n=1 Tax=Collimonas arenae TaxID=279058 RepID=A0A127QK75_9BURK|nr:hypothetical protein CAter282_2218 [Collimonas arenae]
MLPASRRNHTSNRIYQNEIRVMMPFAEMLDAGELPLSHI